MYTRNNTENNLLPTVMIGEKFLKNTDLWYITEDCTLIKENRLCTRCDFGLALIKTKDGKIISSTNTYNPGIRIVSHKRKDFFTLEIYDANGHLLATNATIDACLIYASYEDKVKLAFTVSDYYESRGFIKRFGFENNLENTKEYAYCISKMLLNGKKLPFAYHKSDSANPVQEVNEVENM